MISVSDNTAADMLLHTLGRDNVERMMATIGVADPARNRPFLSTLELSAIKTAPAPALNLWRQADEAGRRRLLATTYAAPTPARIDVARFTGNPLNIDRSNGSPRRRTWCGRWTGSAATATRRARAILAINPALGPAQRSGALAYVGYKGGSEPGVLNLTWLVRSRAGAWHVVTGSWNDPAAPLEELRFVGLMARAVELAREARP